MFINADFFILLLFFHWLADFVAQTDRQAQGKSKDNWILSEHVFAYTCMMMPSFFFNDTNVAWAFLWVFSTHWITDYFTSRLTKKLFKEYDYHNGFIVVGIDQWLHVVQLYIAFRFF